MSKSSRQRWHARQNQMKATIEESLNKELTPVLSQIETVERNPFTPASVEPRGNAKVRSHANLLTEYVPSGLTGYYPFLRALPPYIDDISQQFGLQVYQQMLTDPVVYASTRVFTLGIIANDWELVPSLTREEHDYDVALRMRDFVQESLDNLQTPYDIILEQHLQAFSFGVNVSEQVYRLENDKLYLKDLRDKPLNNTIFVVDSFNDTIGILTQRFPGQNFPAGSYIPIDFSAIGQTPPGKEYDISDIIPGFLPRSLFSVLTNEMRYNDERGHSGLRAAYSPWWLKQQVIAEYLAYLSKYGTPSLVGETAPNAQPQVMLDANLNPLLDISGNPIMKTPEQVLSDALTAFQNGSAIAVPSGSKITPIEVGSNGEAFANALNWCDGQIARAVTSQYLATNEGMHQARASSDVHQDILSLGILRRKHWLENQQQREVYKRLLMYNYDLTGKKISRYVPKLNLGLGDGFPLSPEDIADLMKAGYFGQIPGGADPAQMEKLDERLGMPRRERVNIQTDPMSMPFQNALSQQPMLPEQVPVRQQVQEPMSDKMMKALIGQRPNVTVNLPENMIHVNVPAPKVNVTVPERRVQVNVPKPDITINVPKQNAPKVNVNIPKTDVTVNVPEPKDSIMDVERDARGNISKVTKRTV